MAKSTVSFGLNIGGDLCETSAENGGVLVGGGARANLVADSGGVLLELDVVNDLRQVGVDEVDALGRVRRQLAKVVEVGCNLGLGRVLRNPALGKAHSSLASRAEAAGRSLRRLERRKLGQHNKSGRVVAHVELGANFSRSLQLDFVFVVVDFFLEKNMHILEFESKKKKKDLFGKCSLPSSRGVE